MKIEKLKKSCEGKAEVVRDQLDFSRLQRSQVRIPPRSELFCVFSKIFEIFIKTTFLGVKNHQEPESGVKKFPIQRKTL